MMQNRKNRQSERGSALIYILIAIALLAALTATFMEPSSQQTTSQNSFRSITSVQSQIDTIRSAIQECVLRYSNGDQTASIQTSDPGANQTYPLKPNSTYLASADSDRYVRNLRCPGNNSGTTNDHVGIFSGSSGKFLASPPDLFEQWEYYNGTDGVFFWTSTSKSDAFLQTALAKLDDKYSECEVDVIDATSGSVDMDSDSSSQATCASGSTCFRVWMINAGSAPHGDYADDASCGSSDI